MARRCLAVSFSALARPPFLAPRRPRATAWGFFFLSMATSRCLRAQGCKSQEPSGRRADRPHNHLSRRLDKLRSLVDPPDRHLVTHLASSDSPSRVNEGAASSDRTVPWWSPSPLVGKVGDPADLRHQSPSNRSAAISDHAWSRCRPPGLPPRSHQEQTFSLASPLASVSFSRLGWSLIPPMLSATLTGARGHQPRGWWRGSAGRSRAAPGNRPPRCARRPPGAARPPPALRGRPPRTR